MIHRLPWKGLGALLVVATMTAVVAAPASATASGTATVEAGTLTLTPIFTSEDPLVFDLSGGGPQPDCTPAGGDLQIDIDFDGSGPYDTLVTNASGPPTPGQTPGLGSGWVLVTVNGVNPADPMAGIPDSEGSINGSNAEQFVSLNVSIQQLGNPNEQEPCAATGPVCSVDVHLFDGTVDEENGWGSDGTLYGDDWSGTPPNGSVTLNTTEGSGIAVQVPPSQCGTFSDFLPSFVDVADLQLAVAG